MAKPGTQNKMSYKGLFQGKDPDPQRQPGYIMMQSNLVFLHQKEATIAWNRLGTVQHSALKRGTDSQYHASDFLAAVCGIWFCGVILMTLTFVKFLAFNVDLCTMIFTEHAY